MFQIAVGTVADTSRIVEAARNGTGMGWDEHHTDVHDGCERFFLPGYAANLVSSWLPAVGMVERLEAGARVADVGCGHGGSTILMAQAFPRSRFVGSDYHAASIEVARQRAEQAGVADRIEFEVAGADGFSGTGFDLVTTFDALHDMGDPVGAARHVLARSPPTGPGWWSSRWRGQRRGQPQPDRSRRTTASPPCSARRRRSRSPGRGAGDAGRTRADPRVVDRAGFGRSVRAETPFHRVIEVRVAV